MVGGLDLLLALLQGSPAQESLAVFLVEQGNLEVLLALLVRPRSLPLVSDRVCKVHPACASHSICRGPCLRDREMERVPLGATDLRGDSPSSSHSFPMMTNPHDPPRPDPAQTAAERALT